MNTEEDTKVPFSAGLHRDGSIRIYVDEEDCGLRLIRGDAGTGVMIEAPSPLKAMDTDLDKFKAIKAIWQEWKANNVTSLMSMRDIEAIISSESYIEAIMEEP